MGNGRVFERNPDHLRASQLATFANRIRDLAGLAQSNANATAFIPHDDQGAEVKPASTFDHLGRAIDKHDLVNQLLLLAIHTSLGRIVRRPAAAAAEATVPPRFTAVLGRHFRLLDVFSWSWFSHNIV